MTYKSALVAAVVVAVGGALIAPVQASAEQVPVSELSFNPQNPTFDPYGSGTTIWGAASVNPAGYLDLTGRSVELLSRPVDRACHAA